MHRAVFLDRDGTLNVEKHYLCDPDQLELFPGVGDALQALQSAGYRLFIVTNQSGIGRGYYTEEAMHRVHERLLILLEPFGIRFDHIYFAPEAPGQTSYGRKPSPQFLLDAARDYTLDLSESFMIGDKWVDVECGRNAGVRASLLVRTGYGQEEERRCADQLGDAIVVDDLRAAATYMLEHAS